VNPIRSLSIATFAGADSMHALRDDEIPSIVQEESGRSSASWIERRTRSIRRPRIQIACSAHLLTHATFGAAARSLAASRAASRCSGSTTTRRQPDRSSMSRLRKTGNRGLRGAQPWARRRIPRTAANPSTLLLAKTGLSCGVPLPGSRASSRRAIRARAGAARCR
jgi:hypothetical protein